MQLPSTSTSAMSGRAAPILLRPSPVLSPSTPPYRAGRAGDDNDECGRGELDPDHRLALRMLPFRGIGCRSGMFDERRTGCLVQHAGHSTRNTIAAMTVGRSAPASNPIGKIAPSKKRPSSACPAGFGAFAITVNPPPTTAP